MHWEVEHHLLEKYIPEDLELEKFNGKTYVGTIPFRMENIRPRFLPSIPLISNFPEFHLRTQTVGIELRLSRILNNRGG